MVSARNGVMLAVETSANWIVPSWIPSSRSRERADLRVWEELDLQAAAAALVRLVGKELVAERSSATWRRSRCRTAPRMTFAGQRRAPCRSPSHAIPAVPAAMADRNRRRVNSGVAVCCGAHSFRHGSPPHEVVENSVPPWVKCSENVEASAPLCQAQRPRCGPLRSVNNLDPPHLAEIHVEPVPGAAKKWPVQVPVLTISPAVSPRPRSRSQLASHVSEVNGWPIAARPKPDLMNASVEVEI